MIVHQIDRLSALFFGNQAKRWLLPALLACYIIWGSTFFAIQIALTTYPPFFQMGTRFLVASFILMGWMLWHHQSWPTARQWRDALISGALLIGGGMGLLACAQQYIHSSLAAAMTMLEPIMICTLSALFLGWKASHKEIIGISIGAMGILLLSTQGGFKAEPLGLIYMLGSVTCWSIGSVLVARRLKLAEGASGLASQMLCGGVILLIFSLMFGEVPQTPTIASFSAWVYLVLAGSLGAYGAYIYLVKNASPALYTSYNYVTPVIALIIGISFGGELLHWLEVLGMAICVSGIILLLSPKKKAFNMS